MRWPKRKRRTPDPVEQAALILLALDSDIEVGPRHHILRDVEPTDLLDRLGNVVRRGVCVECSCGHVFTTPVDADAHQRRATRAEALLRGH
jgi:hypothetical protein